jgi:chorismate--pyruvate lyase
MTVASIAGYRRVEPLWRPARRLHRSEIPEKVWHWLLDKASLTERIIGACPGRFRVQVVHQKRGRVMRNEARTLNMRASTHAIVRQVQLVCGEIPWVYARTVIPPATLHRRLRRLMRQGSRSLGSTLFSDPSMKRGEVEVTCLTASDELYGSVTGGLSRKPETIWGRRSVFRLGGKPLLVCEFFLPEIGEFTE